MSSSNPVTAKGNEHVPMNSSQPEEMPQENVNDKDQVNEDVVTKRKRKKTSIVWNDFDEVEISGGAKKAVCTYCKQKFATGGLGANTSHLGRHSILDCPTRWNSTYHMLSAALKFKIAFPSYKEREPHYDYAPSDEDWDRVDKVCQFLEVFNLATLVISGSEYPTSNLYLAEVWRVKQVIDNAAQDTDLFMREMATPMKLKFDKYWGECNLLMAIASVLDPRCKFHVVNICFPLIYKSEEVAQENIKKVQNSLEELYDEYVSISLQELSSTEVDISGSNSSSSSTQSQSSVITGFDRIMSIVREKEAVPAVKSELQTYLDEGVCIPDGDNNSFSALEWWRNNSLKYKNLSKMAADILAIPISTVASESTFSAGGRVIDEYRSKMNEESIEALICGGDWLRHKYNLNRKSKVDEQAEEITLKI